jgi:DNA (cytosine-5)-methyltransferase 1
MKLLSLCTGYGGLDLAAEAYFGAELIGCADIDKSASIAIEKHFSVPNYGDIRNIVNLDLEFDILTAGYPCQPFSEAGQRKGLNDERHIWPHIAEIIGKFRPGIVVLENVRGHLSLGFREVLADLARLGYDSKWRVVRASDIGAPHHRARVFVVSYPNNFRGVWDLPGSSRRHDPCSQGECPCDSKHQHRAYDRQVSQLGCRFTPRCAMHLQATPDALVEGKLNPKFVEYMMGLPEGWVTDLPISRNQQFKLLGNGVVPQQAYYALQLLCD